MAFLGFSRVALAVLFRIEPFAVALVLTVLDLAVAIAISNDVEIDRVIDEMNRLAPDTDDINRPVYLARILTLERLRDLPKSIARKSAHGRSEKPTS